jgi:hypothetical protein
MQIVFGVKRTDSISSQVPACVLKWVGLTPCWQPAPEQESRSFRPQGLAEYAHDPLPRTFLVHDSALQDIGRCAYRSRNGTSGSRSGEVERHPFRHEVGGEEGVFEEVV